MTLPSIATITWAAFQTDALARDYWTEADDGSMVFDAGGTSSGPNLGAYSWPDNAGYMWHTVFPYDGPTYNMTIQGGDATFSLDNSSGDPWNWHMFNGSTDISGTIPYGTDTTYWRVYRSGDDMVLEHSADGTTWDAPSRIATAMTSWNTEFGYYVDLADVGNSTWYDAKGFVYSDSTPPDDPPTAPANVVYVSGLNASPTAPIAVSNIYDFHFPTWNVVVGNWLIGPQYELNNLKNRVLKLTLVDADSFSFSLNGDDPVFQDSTNKIIEELVTDVWIYRDGMLIFRGRIMDSTDNIGDVYTVNFTAYSYEALLEARGLHTLPYHDTADFASTWTPQAIIRFLVEHAENQTGMRLGLTIRNEDWINTLPSLGTIYSVAINDTTVFISVKDGDSILTSVQNVCKIIDPSYGVLDFWIDPFLNCHLALPRGNNNGVILDYGGNIASLGSQFSYKTFGNVVYASGEHVYTDGTVLLLPRPAYYETENLGVPTTPTHTSAAGVHNENLTQGSFSPGTYATDPRGGWQIEKHVESSTLTAAALKTFAQNQWMQTSDIAQQYAYTPVFGPGQWRGTDHVNVGDTVWFYAQRGRINIRRQLVVQSIQIEIDDSGIEKVTPSLNLSNDENLALKQFRAAIKNLQKK